jgi:glycosyltransferase involved in cell wall biosynthesis
VTGQSEPARSTAGEPVAGDLAHGDQPTARRVVFVLGLASGGTARHVGALADGCRAAGLEVAILGPAETLARLPAGADMASAGRVDADTGSTGRGGADIAVVRIGDRPHPARDAAAIAGLRARLAARRADVVHAHGVRAGAFAALAIASLRRQARPALAVTVHNAPPDGGLARLAYGVLERVCVRRADLVLCVSADLLSRMRRLGAAAAARFDVPAPERPAPTAADVAAARADIGADGRPVVLAVARLAPQKGLDVLVDAAASWRDRDPQPRTVIAGDGPLGSDLRTHASQAGADVALLGARDDVPALLAVADVVVVPSRWEARSLVIQEAMRSGRPIVATRVGGTAELTGADGALLVPPDDAPALAGAVTAVLDDAALAARLSQAARVSSAAFPTQQDAVRSALAIYARLSASRTAGHEAARAGR